MGEDFETESTFSRPAVISFQFLLFSVVGATLFSRLNFILGISPVLWRFQCTDAYSSCVFQIVAQRAGETQVRCHPSDL